MSQDIVKIDHQHPQRRGSLSSVSELRRRLESIESEYDVSHEILNDPVSMAMSFKCKGDREVAALLCAVFAYGNVKQIQASLRKIFEILGPAPAERLRTMKPLDWKKLLDQKKFEFKHRFNTAIDLVILFSWIGQALRSHGTLEDFFVEGLSGSAADIGPALDSFVAKLTAFSTHPLPKASQSTLFLLSKPSDGSACKRMLLFLRWVTGHGPMDLGLWTKVPRGLLLIPVDTHVLRISKHLGFTRRNDASWRTAQEITSALRMLDPVDPVRFDFALCHLGISRECPSRVDLKICSKCRMNDLCRTFRRRKGCQGLRSELPGPLTEAP